MSPLKDSIESIMKIALLVIFTLESYKCYQNSEVQTNPKQVQNNNIATSYFIKFLTPGTKYPIELVDDSNDSKTQWYKYGAQDYVSNLKHLPKGFLSFQNNYHGGTSLMINNFTSNTKFLLDHYEPQPSDLNKITANEESIQSILLQYFIEKL